MPESAGLYFSWGNTDGHPAGAGYDFSQEVYDNTPAAAIADNLSLSQDAARALLGAPWRMPTSAEFQELFDNCNSIWTTLNGVNGRLLTSQINGAQIFLPTGGSYIGTNNENRNINGRYWSATHVYMNEAYNFAFSANGVNPQNDSLRHYGYNIRPVFDPNL